MIRTIFFFLILGPFVTYSFIVVRRSDQNSNLHRYYLAEISRINKIEISNHIYEIWPKRYDWLTKCHTRAHEDWRIWKPIRSYYEGAEQALKPAQPDDKIYTYHLHPNIPTTRE